MDALLDEPAVVLVLFAFAATLFIVEIALPTAGVAGTLAIVLSVTAVVAIDRQGAEWWPLLGPKVAVLLWAVMIARRARSGPQEAIAVALFGIGSVAFGLLAESPLTAALGATVAASLGAGFPKLHAAACHLLEGPIKVGMDSLVGQPGEVATWSDGVGTVIVEGSRWNAVGDADLEVSEAVAVIGYTGMTVTVARRVHHETSGV